MVVCLLRVRTVKPAETAVAREWLSISHMVNLADTNTTIKDSVFYAVHAGAI
jgi:hypothetical protein